jgi:hypothetical protein
VKPSLTLSVQNANSLELKTFEPQNKEAWDAAYEKFLKVKK